VVGKVVGTVVGTVVGMVVGILVGILVGAVVGRVVGESVQKLALMLVCIVDKTNSAPRKACAGKVTPTMYIPAARERPTGLARKWPTICVSNGLLGCGSH
jgi:hypothetical protein